MSVGFTKLPKESVEKKKKKNSCSKSQMVVYPLFLWEDNESARETYLEQAQYHGHVNSAAAQDPCSKGDLVLGIYTLQAPS